MTTLTTVTTAWVPIATGSQVTFQVSHLEVSGSKVIFLAANSAPAAGSALGWKYCVNQGEVAKAVSSFGNGTTLYARTESGTAGVTSWSWS